VSRQRVYARGRHDLSRHRPKRAPRHTCTGHIRLRLYTTLTPSNPSVCVRGRAAAKFGDAPRTQQSRASGTAGGCARAASAGTSAGQIHPVSETTATPHVRSLDTGGVPWTSPGPPPVCPRGVRVHNDTHHASRPTCNEQTERHLGRPRRAHGTHALRSRCKPHTSSRYVGYMCFGLHEAAGKATGLADPGSARANTIQRSVLRGPSRLLNGLGRGAPHLSPRAGDCGVSALHVMLPGHTRTSAVVAVVTMLLLVLLPPPCRAGIVGTSVLRFGCVLPLTGADAVAMADVARGA
jgi:hypothetical protein